MESTHATEASLSQPDRLPWEKPTVHKISLDVTAGGNNAAGRDNTASYDYRLAS